MVFIEVPQNMTVPVNTTVHIFCRPNGTSVVGWQINDEPLRTPSYPRHISPGDSNLFQLNVYSAHEVNGTVFQCFTNRNNQVFSSEKAILTIREEDAPNTSKILDLATDDTHSKGRPLTGN